jgi:hypothetical protein
VRTRFLSCPNVLSHLFMNEVSQPACPLCACREVLGPAYAMLLRVMFAAVERLAAADPKHGDRWEELRIVFRSRGPSVGQGLQLFLSLLEGQQHVHCNGSCHCWKDNSMCTCSPALLQPSCGRRVEAGHI